MQIGQVIPLIVDLLHDIVFFWVILLSFGEARNKRSLLVTALKQNIEHWQLLQLNLLGYVGYYWILELTVPLQLNFTVIIEVLFKLSIMMSSMNVLNILILIVTSFVIICFRQGTKNRFFRPIFRRKIGFRWEWIEISMEKIGWEKIGIKSLIFLKNPIFR